jgi:hypothetical protein
MGGGMMLSTIINIALFTGIALGATLLIIVCMTYYHQKRFGLGGALLSFLGVVLLGLSIWSEVEFSFGRMKFHAMREHMDELAMAFDSTMAAVDRLEADQDTLMLHVAKVQDHNRLFFSNNIPPHLQDDITGIFKRDTLIERRIRSIRESETRAKKALGALLNARKTPSP